MPCIIGFQLELVAGQWLMRGATRWAAEGIEEELLVRIQMKRKRLRIEAQCSWLEIRARKDRSLGG